MNPSLAGYQNTSTYDYCQLIKFQVSATLASGKVGWGKQCLDEKVQANCIHVDIVISILIDLEYHMNCFQKFAL